MNPADPPLTPSESALDAGLAAAFGDSGTAPYASPDLEPGVVLAGKYRLSERIGEGGMGSVWVAQQSEPVKRKVAVKLIKAGMDSKQVIARFEAERQALAMMDHPNIAKVLDGGLHEGRPFFVMELVKGVPITQYCDANKLTPQQRLELFVPVCQAIQHAHQKGIIHRDIKPSNVLIALYDDKPVVKVIDFGVAKATGGALTDQTIETGFGGVVGTPQYMSPEQATFNNLDIDTRSDVYALGVLLYELLTGSPPFTKKDLEQKGLLEMLRVVREEEPPRPSTRLSTADALPSISANRGTEPKKLTGLLRNELDWIVMKALEKDRTRRYETANGFAADVLRYLSGEAVQAHPPSTAYRVKKFVRRNRVQVVAGVTMITTLLAGVTSAVVVQVRANRDLAAKNDELVAQRTRAEKARDRTRDVLDAMTSEVTGESLSTQKEISAEQKKFLTEVLTYYREFAGEKADDEQSRSRAASAAYRVGLIEYRLGRREPALAAFRLARDGYRTLATDFPLVVAYQNELAKSHNGLGIQLDDLGNDAAALAEYRNAIAIQEELADRFPTVPTFRQGLAISQSNLGILLKNQRQLTDAEQQVRKALAIREKLVADFPTKPAFRRELAVSQSNLGALLKELGHRTEAEEEYRKALVVREKLVIDFPTTHECRHELAVSHSNLGVLLEDQGKQAEAEQQVRKALAIREKLVADFPGVPEYRQFLAHSHFILGSRFTGQRQFAAAEEQFRKGLMIQEKLVADLPAMPDYRHDLASSHNNFGVLLMDLGKRTEAEEQFRKALAIRKKLVADFPTVLVHQVCLGGIYCNFGELARVNGQDGESLGWFDKAIATLTPAYQVEPRNVTAKQFLANSYEGRAKTYGVLRKLAESMQDWDRAIELSSPAEQLDHRASRATSRVQAGQIPEGVAEVAELTKASKWKSGQWYDFARVYVIASGKIADKKQEYADRAMELLHRAVKAGYKDAAHLKKDTDLDSLRMREDFKKLLAELEANTPPPQKRQ